MKETLLQRAAWTLALMALAILAIAAVLLLLVPAPFNTSWWEPVVKAFVTMGAPILGLLILIRRPRDRYGWLWLVYALFTAIRTLSLAFFFFNHSQSTGYSFLGYFLLWLSEPSTIATFLCMILLILWFPDGQLPLRRWRFLYWWMLVATLLLSIFLFVAGTQWNGPGTEGGIVIENPFGWIPENTSVISLLVPLGFFSIVLIFVLAVVALLLRYRSARSLVRRQIRWFLFGSMAFVILNFLPVFLPARNPNIQLVLSVIGFAAIIPLYLAVGIAILRYRLYDIDVIIRKTLVYSLLTGLLALVYFGSVVLLQNLFESLSGQESPLVIVISTLGIASLFTPLRRRVQDAIDRRFYRRKYNAARSLDSFAASARDETDIGQLEVELVKVVQETLQPESVGLWITPSNTNEGRFSDVVRH
jgi:hypothetical protein